ncbi:MAG: 50S ribosomal protein L22 [Patescibacteria group bacterium]|jgi:large subunit ribosomal protein L22
MEVKASLRHLRIAPRKVRLVIGLIRGKSVQEAERQLLYLSKLSAQPILKLLLSAKANAKNNFDLDPEGMYIKSITANEGKTLKRYLPRAMGKADIMRKRATHIDLVLEEYAPKDAGKGKPGRTDVKNEKKEAVKPVEKKIAHKKVIDTKERKQKESPHSSKK